MSKRIRGVPSAPAEHNYLKKLIEIQAARGGGLPVPTKPGGVTDCFVSHDNWCRALKGGTCNCDPQITFRARS